MQRLLLHLFIIQRIKLETLSLRNRISPLLDDPTLPQWGRGRVDTFNPYKAIQFIGTSPGCRVPNSWRRGLPFFLEPAAARRNAPALGWEQHISGRAQPQCVGWRPASPPVTVDYAAIQRVHELDSHAAPAHVPVFNRCFRAHVGKTVYDAHCAQSHSFTGSKTGTVEDIAVDRNRRLPPQLYTYVLATSQALLFPDSEHRFQHFSKTNGYRNVPLDGVWARAPYLHNGSVPTLADLLNPPAERPKFLHGI